MAWAEIRAIATKTIESLTMLKKKEINTMIGGFGVWSRELVEVALQMKLY